VSDGRGQGSDAQEGAADGLLPAGGLDYAAGHGCGRVWSAFPEHV